MEDQYHVFVVGTRCHGKSSLCNLLLDNQVNPPQKFREGNSAVSTTVSMQEEPLILEKDSKRYEVRITDTVGLDGDIPFEQIRESFRDKLSTIKNVAKVILVFSVTEKQFKSSTLASILQAFGPTFVHNFHVVYTHCDEHALGGPASLLRTIWGCNFAMLNYLRRAGFPISTVSYSCVLKHPESHVPKKIRKLGVDVATEIEFLKSSIFNTIESGKCVSTSGILHYYSTDELGRWETVIDNLKDNIANIKQYIKVKNSTNDYLSFSPTDVFDSQRYETYNALVGEYRDLLHYYAFLKLDMGQSVISIKMKQPVEVQEFIESVESYISSFKEVLQEHLFPLIFPTRLNLRFGAKSFTSNTACIEKGTENLIFIDCFRRCPTCGALWGNEAGCYMRKCGCDESAPGLVEYLKAQPWKGAKYPKRMILEDKSDIIKNYSYACGSKFEWRNAVPVFICEVSDVLNLSRLQFVSEPYTSLL